MPDTTYRVVRDHRDGSPRVLIRGARERYNGAGGWVADGAVMRYFGLGGDADDAVEISAEEVPEIMAIIDARFAARAQPTDADIECALRQVEATPTSPDGLPSPEEGRP